MLKGIIKLLCMTVTASLVIGGVFVAVSVIKGGDFFRSFGSAVKEKSLDAGKTADRIKSLVDDVKETAKNKGEKIKSVTSNALEDVSEKAGDTREMLKNASHGGSDKGKNSGKAISNLSGD